MCQWWCQHIGPAWTSTVHTLEDACISLGAKFKVNKHNIYILIHKYLSSTDFARSLLGTGTHMWTRQSPCYPRGLPLYTTTNKVSIVTTFSNENLIAISCIWRIVFFLCRVHFISKHTKRCIRISTAHGWPLSPVTVAFLHKIGSLWTLGLPARTIFRKVTSWDGEGLLLFSRSWVPYL